MTTLAIPQVTGSDDETRVAIERRLAILAGQARDNIDTADAMRQAVDQAFRHFIVSDADLALAAANLYTGTPLAVAVAAGHITITAT